MMAPPDKDGIAGQCAVPRTQGKDNQFWTGFPLRSFFMRKDCGGRKLFVLKHSCNWLLPETRKDGWNMYYDLKESGKRIKEMRKQAGYTQEQLAEAVGVGCQTIANIENGRKGAGIDTLIIVSEVFGCTLDYLILGRRTIGLNVDIPEEKKDFAEKMLKAILDNM